MFRINALFVATEFDKFLVWNIIYLLLPFTPSALVLVIEMFSFLSLVAVFCSLKPKETLALFVTVMP